MMAVHEGLPPRWELRRLKYSYREVDNRSQTGDEEMLSVSHITGVTPRSQKNVNMFMAESNIGLKTCHPNDIVVNTMWAWMAAMGVSNYNGIVSPSYGVYRPYRDVYNPEYLDLLLRTEEYRTEYMRRSTGINSSRLRLYPDQFLSISVILPPHNEQDKIVQFLNWKASGINRLINAKKKQIALLQEEIDVLVSHSITMSQNKKRMKYTVDIIRNWINRNNSYVYSPVGVLNRGRGVFHKEKILGSDLGSSDFFKVEPNALILSGQFAWEGAVAFTTEKERDCIASHRYYTVRGINNVCETEYLWAFFQTKYGDLLLNRCSHGAAGRNKPLNFNELLNEYLPLPSIKIQSEIAKQVRLYMKYREVVKRFEVLASEYRTRLISDVVTGKMDVQSVIIPDYEAVNEVADTTNDVLDETEGENGAN